MRSGIVGGIVAGSVILAGSALAGSGIGGIFNLGQSNTVSQTSLLAGSTAHDQLDVANFNTGSTAKALGLLGKSSIAPAAAIANTGGGPALGLSVNNGQSPFTVNSATKVANLNADKLDGVDSSAFAGTGAGSTKVLSDRIVVPSVPSGGDRNFLTLPGFGYMHGSCSATDGALLLFFNTSGSTLDFWEEALGDGHPRGGFLSTGGGDVVALYRDGEQHGGPFALGLGNDPGARRMAIGQGYAFQSADNQPCGFEATVTIWSSP